MHLANGSQTFREKRGKFSGNRAKAFLKRSVVLTSVKIRSFEGRLRSNFQNQGTAQSTERDDASVG